MSPQSRTIFFLCQQNLTDTVRWCQDLCVMVRLQEWGKHTLNEQLTHQDVQQNVLKAFAKTLTPTTQNKKREQKKIIMTNLERMGWQQGFSFALGFVFQYLWLQRKSFSCSVISDKGSRVHMARSCSLSLSLSSLSLAILLLCREKVGH